MDKDTKSEVWILAWDNNPSFNSATKGCYVFSNETDDKKRLNELLCNFRALFSSIKGHIKDPDGYYDENGFQIGVGNNIYHYWVYSKSIENE